MNVLASAHTPAHPAYRPDIDGLRALAVIAVVVYHAFPGLLGSGYIGVDIFFVISGFLISSILFTQIAMGQFTIGQFYARRIRRIFPALILVMLVSYALGWYLLFAGELAQLGKHIGAGAGFFSNWALWHEAGYFASASERKPLLHLWSLGIEEQFYIFWPLLLWLGHQRRIGLLWFTLLLFLASFLFNLYYAETHQATADFFSPFSRFWELMAGGLLAYITQHPRPCLQVIVRGFPEQLAFAGLLVLLAGLLLIRSDSIYPGAAALIPVLGTVLLIAAGPNAWINRKVLAHPLMVGIGLISYPLYLWHWPLLAFARIINHELPPPGIRLLSLMLSVLLAFVTWRWIEQPVRSAGKFKSRRLVLTLSIAMLLLGASGVFTQRMQGFPARSANASAWQLGDIQDQNGVEKSRANQCRRQLPEVLAAGVLCYLPDAHPAYLVLGDSHAQSIARAVERDWLRFSALILSNNGCLPFLNAITRFQIPMPGARDCGALGKTALDVLNQLPDIKTVLLVARGPVYFSGLDFGQQPGQRGPLAIHALDQLAPFAGQAAEDAFVNGYIDLVQRIMAARRQVILVMDWPELDFDPTGCVSHRIAPWHTAPRCQVDRSRVIERQRVYRELITRINHAIPELKVYDPTHLFCHEQVCDAMAGGRLFYNDNNHLSAAGSQAILKDLLGPVIP